MKLTDSLVHLPDPQLYLQLGELIASTGAEGFAEQMLHLVDAQVPIHRLELSEWTLDQYTPDYFKTVATQSADPRIPPSTKYPKSVRGGGFTDKPDLMRSAARLKSEPAWNKRDPQIPKSKWWLTDGMSVGFRVVSPLQQPTPEEAKAYYEQYISL
ncbi:MAG: hypothetical protein EOP49_35570 [Sphingobacteriales bacterium]|nr:MAG: hypothetical protein EOP49_35570 [Sphingobacteriales bacterium]